MFESWVGSVPLMFEFDAVDVTARTLTGTRQRGRGVAEPASVSAVRRAGVKTGYLLTGGGR